MKRRKAFEQIVLPFRPKWGGSRAGAGRKRRSTRALLPHRARPKHQPAHPVHVTLRSGCRSLRTQFVFPTVRAAIAAANRRARDKFRIVEFSVQDDHIHFIVETESRSELIGGVRGVSIRIARNVNKLVGRRGRFFTDRWHGRALASPRAVRHAIVYVLANHRKHHPEITRPIDPYSSAPYFPSFVEYQGSRPFSVSAHVIPRSLAPPQEPPICPAETWLLSQGWKRCGSISIQAHPKRPCPDARGRNRFT